MTENRLHHTYAGGLFPSLVPVSLARMANRSLYPLIDRLFAGKFDSWLTERRAEGLSYSSIRDRLRDGYDLTVSSETIRVWIHEYVGKDDQ